jgi:hypothetical protein
MTEMPNHWSFKLPDLDAALPVGQFAQFERAVDCLAPITTLHREFAHQFRVCVCVRCASDGIQKLAVDYNSNRLLNKEAPRVKHVIHQAEVVRRSADQLLKAVLALDDYSRQAFQQHGKSNAVCDLPLYAGYFRSDPDPDPGPDSDCLWVSNLLDLIDAAGRVSDNVKRSRGVNQHERADKGGRTNLFKEEHGSPDRNLVWAGWHLYEQFKPDQAKGTEHGPFHEFLKLVVRYATGKNSSPSLGPWIKVLASPLRQRYEILRRYFAAEDELKSFERTPSEEGASARREHLHRQSQAASQELEKITLILKLVGPGKKAHKRIVG